MFKKVSDILDKQKSELELFDFLELIRVWDQIVGPKLAKSTIPLKNQRSTLTIMTNHSAYSQSLSFAADQLRKKIYRKFPQLKGKIKEFKFQVSTEHFEQKKLDLLKRAKIDKTQEVKQKKQNTFHPHNPRYKSLRIQAEKEFADIDDQDLKSHLVSIYIQNQIK